MTQSEREELRAILAAWREEERTYSQRSPVGKAILRCRHRIERFLTAHEGER